MQKLPVGIAKNCFQQRILIVGIERFVRQFDGSRDTAIDRT